MSAPDFDIADEFRFLAIQCEAQAGCTHREQDAGFIRLLAANIFQLGGHASIEFVAALIAEMVRPDEPLPALLRRTATALHEAAGRIERAEAVA